MVILCNRTDHYIFALWFLSSFFFFLPHLISAAEDWMSTILHTWCGHSANLRCMSETCCTRLAENAGCKSRQKSPSGHHRTTLSGYIFATKARIDNRKKNLLSSDMSSTCPHNMVNFGLLTAEIDPVVWGTPANFNGLASWQRYCMASSSGRQPNFAALNRGRHLCSAGQPSRWALAHILVGSSLNWFYWESVAI